MKLKPILKTGLTWVLAPIVRLFYRHKISRARSQPRKVLFVANNELMLEHIQAVWQAYDKKDEYIIHLCSSETITFKRAKRQTARNMQALARSAGMDFWPDFIACKLDWTLLITAEPDLACHTFTPGTKKILIQHGMLGFKSVDGFLYPYHPARDFLPDGRCKFDAIFDANRVTCEKMCAIDPRYTGVIQIAGPLAADALMELNKDRSQIRAAMGFAPDDKVVLIQSTFRESLIEDLGVELLEQCQRLALERGWHFIISLHPNHWRGDYAADHPWGATALRYASAHIHVRSVDEDANLALVASDIAVSDHTSLSYNFALLGKPMLFYLPPRGNQVMELFGPLVDCGARFESAEELCAGLQEAEEVFNRRRVESLLADMLPYLGRAKARNNEVLGELLKRV